jgi:hypothetical protein
MAKYRCTEVVRWLQAYANEKTPFSAKQKLNLAVHLFYGKFRGNIKKLYYHYWLKVSEG